MRSLLVSTLPLVVWLAACPDFVPPPDARISCGPETECPTGWTCEPTVGRCLPVKKSDEEAPTLLDFSVAPNVAGANDVITVSLTPSEALDRPATVVFGDDEATFLEEKDGVLSYSFVVPDGQTEDEARLVEARFVDPWANAGQARLGNVSLDYTPPRGELVLVLPEEQTAVGANLTLSATVEVEADVNVVGSRVVAEPGGDVIGAVSVGTPAGSGNLLSIPLEVDLEGADFSDVTSVVVEADVVGARPTNASPLGVLRSAPVPVDLVPPQQPTLAFVEGIVSTDSGVTAILGAEGATEFCLEGDLADSPDCELSSSFEPIPQDSQVVVTLSNPPGAKTVTAHYRDGAGWRTSASATIVWIVGEDGVLSAEPTLTLPLGQTSLKEGDTVEVNGHVDAGATIVSARLVDPASGATVMHIANDVVTVREDGVSLAGAFTLAGTAADANGGSSVELEVIVALGPVTSAAENSRSAPVQVDNVLPRAPVRQCVLTFPRHVRFALARDKRRAARVIGIWLRALGTLHRRRARGRGTLVARTAAVTFVQRFGTALDLNFHMHSVLVDGVRITRFVSQAPNAPTALLFAEPRHPYTRALLAAAPVPDPARRKAFVAPLGEPASALSPPAGCALHPRCADIVDRCRTETPPLVQIGGRRLACHVHAAG